MYAKRIRGQMSESMLTAVFIILSGGLQDSYTYLCRGKVFANAQTGVGRGATQQATTLKQESASSKMCWVRHRRSARQS